MVTVIRWTQIAWRAVLDEDRQSPDLGLGEDYARQKLRFLPPTRRTSLQQSKVRRPRKPVHRNVPRPSVDQHRVSCP
jgi:hypothetical protein